MNPPVSSPAIDPQSSAYYNGGKYQPGSVQAPSVSANSTAPVVQYQVPQNNVASQISAANNTSPIIATTSPVFNANAAQEDYQAKLAAYKTATAALDQQASTQQRVQLDAAANQAAKDLQASELGLKQQSNQIQQTQADAANTAAQAKLTAANGLSAPSGTPQNAPGTAQTAATPAPSSGQNPAIQTSQNTLDYIQNVQGIQDQRTQALGTFLQTANTMIVGLQSSEAALVNATTQQFQNILNAQSQSNASQLGAATENAARTGQEYNPTGTAGTIANVIQQGNQRLSEINSTMATTLANLDQNFAKEEYSLMNENYAKLDQSFTDRMTAFSDVHSVISQDAAAQLKTQQDSQAEIDKQTQIRETAIKDAADIQNQQASQKIAQADLRLRQATNSREQATWNVTYGQFLNKDGTPNTTVAPSSIPGYTQLPTGQSVVVDTNNLYKTPTIGGLPVISPANYKVLSETTNGISTVNQMQALYNQTVGMLGQGNGANASSNVNANIAQYNNMKLALPTQVQAMIPNLSPGMNTIFGPKSSVDNPKFGTAISFLNNTIQSVAPGVHTAPFGQVFTSPSQAQSYFSSTGQQTQYAGEVAKANALAQQYFGRNADDGEIMQVLNGQ